MLKLFTSDNQQPSPRPISINCDMAEGFGAYSIGNDDALLDYITAANAACGFHAGDPVRMLNFASQARESGVSLGAHPGFPDLQGFGRRRMTMSQSEIRAMVIYQIGALQAVAGAAGTNLTHVKPHGALSNMAAENSAYADAISEAILATDPELAFIVHYGSEMHRSAERLGVPHLKEGYADRRYGDDGNLAPRSRPGTVISDPEEALEQTLRMIEDGEIASMDGNRLLVEVDTICVHGDQPAALPVAKAVREGLEANGKLVGPISRQHPPTQSADQPPT